MADASGTPTANVQIPTYNTAVDPPSGKGNLAQMGVIDQLLSGTLSLKTLGWGPTGGGSTIDTNLYRIAASRLRTDSQLETGSNLWLATNAGTLSFGASNDTSLFRHSAGRVGNLGSYLSTSTGDAGYIYYPGTATGEAIRTQVQTIDASDRFRLMYDGTMWWGDGTNTPDISMYRSGINQLATSHQLLVSAGLSSQVQIGAGANAGITLGSAADTNLYRSGAGVVKTDGQLFAQNSMYAYGGTDPSFQASAAAFRIRSGAPLGNPLMGRLEWSPDAVTYDTNLYRSAANTLKTDGALDVAGRVDGTLTGSLGSTGTIIQGTGFTVTKGATGIYTVNWSAAFAAIPTVVAIPNNTNGFGYRIIANTVTTGLAGFQVFDGTGALVDAPFTFIAMRTK